MTCTFIRHNNKYFSYLLDSSIPNANTKEWKINFSFEKCVSNKHFRNMMLLCDSGHFFFSDISSSLWLHLRISYWFQSDINVFYYFCGMDVDKFSFCIFAFFLFFILLKICPCAFQKWHIREKISVLAFGLGWESVLRLGEVQTCGFIQDIKSKL